MRGPKPKKVILQVEQVNILQTHLKTQKTEQRVLRRARVLLSSHEGEQPSEIARDVGCDPATVWRALRDLPRPGAPRRIFPPPESSNSGAGVRAAHSKG